MLLLYFKCIYFTFFLIVVFMYIQNIIFIIFCLNLNLKKIIFSQNSRKTDLYVVKIQLLTIAGNSILFISFLIKCLVIWSKVSFLAWCDILSKNKLKMLGFVFLKHLFDKYYSFEIGRVVVIVPYFTICWDPPSCVIVDWQRFI